MKYDDKYLNRIASQHKIKPKYMAWLSALLDKVQDLHDLSDQLDAAFDLDTAVGVQLDMIGQSIGVSRLLNFEPVYASARLSDDHYRMILRARISLNQWDGTTAGIHQLWDGIFNGYTLEVVDNQDMTMTMRVYGLTSMFQSEYISRGYAAPKPEGVGVNYEFILSFTVESSLYIGAKVADVRTDFDWNTKAAPEDMNVATGVFVGGIIGNVHGAFSFMSKTLSDNKVMAGELFTGGVMETSRETFSLLQKAILEDDAVDGDFFVGGTIGSTRTHFVLGADHSLDNRTLPGFVYLAGKIAVAQTCFALGSRDSPEPQSISGKLSAGGRMAVLHTSFSLPCGTN